MASALRFLAVTLLLLSLTTTVVSVEEDELESMLNVLRSRGHNLFSNAISTSDIIYEAISGKSFTFFAPTDSALFTLDMISTASDYISTLRCHVIPIRLLYPELRRLPSGSSLPTLVKNHRAILRLDTRRSRTSSDDCITIDGVCIALPDLFYSRNLAVHGLRGNLNCTLVQDSTTGNQSSPSPAPGSVISHSREGNRRHTHPPPPLNFSSETGSNTSENVQNPEVPSPSATNLHDDHGCSSPVVSEGQAKPSPVVGGFPPSHSPAHANLPPQVFSACDLWSDAPTSSVPSPSPEPGPQPEFSENDDPMAFPPSATEIQGAHHKAARALELNSMDEDEKEMPLIIENELNNESSDSGY